MSAEESSDSQPRLHAVDPRIWSGQACVRDVQVAEFQTDVVFRAEDVYTEGGLGGEVHGVCAGGDIVVGEERAAAEFEIGGEAAVTFEVPLEPERIKTYAVGSVGGLEDEENRDPVDGILKPAPQKAGQVRPGQDPSIAQACVEDAGATSSSANGVAASRPYLHFVAALFWTSLGETQGRSD